MEQYINEFGKPVWKGVSLGDAFSKELFYTVYEATAYYETSQWAFHSNLGSLTVIDKNRGYGNHDMETGYRDPEGKFWLASVGQDVRLSGVATVGDAIEWVKARANTCVGIQV